MVSSPSKKISATERDEIFDPEFLGRLRAIALRLRKRKQLRKKGMQSTPATGFTREFKDFRHYTPNDDYRAIDWRLYARLERLFVRLYEEVQEFHVHLVVDTSASMVEPHADKRITALRLAAALGYLGLAGGHRVNVYGMRDKITGILRPLKGQGNTRALVDHLAGLEYGGATDLEACFQSFRPTRQRYGIIFVLSDFFGQDVQATPEILARAATWPGEVHMIQVANPLERSPELEGEVQLIDVETSESRRLFFTKRERAKYEKVFDTFVENCAAACVRRQIDHVLWPTDQSFEEAFVSMLSRGSALSQA